MGFFLLVKLKTRQTGGPGLLRPSCVTSQVVPLQILLGKGVRGHLDMWELRRGPFLLNPGLAESHCEQSCSNPCLHLDLVDKNWI